MRVVFIVFFFSKEQNNFITGKRKLEEQWLGLGLGLGLFFMLYFSCCIFHIIYFVYYIYILDS